MDLFPALPQDLAAVETDELRGLLDEIRDRARLLSSGELETGELTAEEVIEQTRVAKASAEAIRAELTARADAESNFQSDVNELASDIVGDEDEASEGDEGDGEGDEASVDESEGESELAAEAEEGDGEGDGEDEGGETDAEGESSLAPAESTPPAATAAAAEVTPQPQARRLAIPRGPGRFQPQATGERAGNALVASGALTTPSGRRIREGQELDRLGFAESVIGTAKRVWGAAADGVKFPVARVEFQFDPEMTLLPNDPEGNLRKLQAIGSPFLGEHALDALLASGGICAPPTPFYDVPGFASRARPVRAALPSFNAVRGGVSVPGVSTIGDITSAITHLTEAQDAQGGTFATKSCQDMDCPDWTDVFVDIISHCRLYGNLNARTWPEGVALENDNTMAAHARVAETFLLDRIKALSLQVTTAHVYSSLHDLIYGIARSKASIRNVLRADEGIGFSVLLPEWVQDMVQAEMATMHVDVDRFVARSRVESILENFGVSVYWYKDSPSTGTTQNFAEEAGGGAVDDFPDAIQYALYINGSFIHVDGGELELGIVRDSVLNETNDFSVFGETFENVARVGPEQGARWITATVCPSGQFPALATALSCA
jgi:hypothetical protein